MLAIHTWLQSLDINALPSTEELLNFFVDSIIATGVKIDETSQLHAILKVIPTKLGQDPIAVSALNMKIKLNASENKVGN